MLEYSAAIVLSVLLRFTTSDYTFGIFKLFSKKSNITSGYMKMGSISGNKDPVKKVHCRTMDHKQQKSNTYHLPTVTGRTRQK
jgi:hypothetical protein